MIELVRYLKISVELTCQGTEEYENTVETTCTNCITKAIKQIENIKGANFKVQKINIDKILDLKLKEEKK